MKEQYSTVCSKMIEHYSNYLYEKELLALQKIIKLDNYDNLNIIIFINKLIDRIWQMTLTKPINFKKGQPFIFLTTRDLIPLEYNLSGISDFEKRKTFSLELITEDTATNTVNGINGMIVEIDYQNQLSEPLLPIDFSGKKRIFAKTKLNVTGIYNISLGLEKYDANEELTDYFSSLTYLPKVDINKALYNFKKNNTILDKNDKESLANTMIVYYLIENNYDKNSDLIKIRDTLKNKYKTKIANKYLKYFNNKITLEEFINYVFNLLDNDIYLLQVDKIM